MRRKISGMLALALLAMLAGRTVTQASWTENIKLKGDARFRYQNTDEDGKDARERWRFRGRIGVSGKVNDKVKADLRLVTNAGDPISDNITMDNGFDDPTARLDRVFFTWTPVDDLGVRFGKMSQPWIAVDDLVFSGDVNPEGIALNYKAKAEALEAMLHGGAYVLKERKADDESMLYSGQGALKIKTGEKSHVLVGASVYAYDNIKGFEEIGKFEKNSTVTVGEGDDAISYYAGDYTIVEGFAQATFDVGVPLTVGAQYMVNTDAFSSEDVGYLGMVKTKLPNGVGLGYQYRYVEKDANLGSFAENTDFGNGTDVQGHIPYVSYDIDKNFSVKVLYAMGQKGTSGGADINTFKIDLVSKF